jgi:hypothetical protein
VADCPKLQTCPFFGDRLADVPSVAGLLKQRYCRGDYARCARYRVVMAGVTVADDLYPNQAGRVERVLDRR